MATVTLPPGTHILDGEQAPYYVKTSDPLEDARRRLTDLLDRWTTLTVRLQDAKTTAAPIAERVNAELYATADYLDRAEKHLEYLAFEQAEFALCQAEICAKMANQYLHDAGAYAGSVD